MSADLWNQAERFYLSILPLFAILFFIGLMALIFILSYTSKKSILRKRLLIGYFSFFTCIGGISFFLHQRYSDWMEARENITPAILTHQTIFFRRVEEDPAVVELYRNSINQLEAFRMLEMYEEQEETLALDYEYIGTTGRNHYFLVDPDRNYVMRYVGDVKYTEGESYIQGTTFRLADQEFMNIGFLEPDYAILETLYVNKAEAEQSEGQDINYSLVPYHPTTLIDGWVMPFQPIGGTNLDSGA